MERKMGYMERWTKRPEMEGRKWGRARERLSVSGQKHINQLIAIMHRVIPLSTPGLSPAEGVSIIPTDLVQQLPAEVPSQKAVQRLLLPAQGHPSEVLLEAELTALEVWLRQCANQKAAFPEVVRTYRQVSRKYV
jgi:hypothetical protein